MDKNTITGFVLLALLFIGFGWYNQPSEEQMAEYARQDSIAKAKQKEIEEKEKQNIAEFNAKKEENLKNDSSALFFSALNGKAKEYVLENEKLQLVFSSKGATPVKAIIKGFKDREGNDNVTLFDGKDQELNFIFEGKEHNILTSNLYFDVESHTDSTIKFVAKAAEGKNLILSYQLGGSYMLHAQLSMQGMGNLFSPSCKTMDIEWREKCKQQEKGFSSLR